MPSGIITEKDAQHAVLRGNNNEIIISPGDHVAALTVLFPSSLCCARVPFSCSFFSLDTLAYCTENKYKRDCAAFCLFVSSASSVDLLAASVYLLLIASLVGAESERDASSREQLRQFKSKLFNLAARKVENKLSVWCKQTRSAYKILC